MGLEIVVGCLESKVVYVVFFGGCVVVVVMKVEVIEGVEWKDLGMLEMFWINWVKDFGFLIILIDIYGNNIFEINKKIYNDRKFVVLGKISE